MKKRLKNWLPFRYKRYYIFALLTIISVGLPFIVIDGHHFLLLSFDYFEFHLFFIKFDMQELYLIPILLMLLFVGVFFMTALGGRVWCGWVCPQTIFRVVYRDLIETKILRIRKRIKNKQEKVEGQYIKKIIAVLIWTVLSALATANFLWYFIPPEDFFKQIMNPGEHYILFGVFLSTIAFLVYDIVKMKEDFCIYVCPYARIQSVMYDKETVQTVYNPLRGGAVYNSAGIKQFDKKPELLAMDSSAECTLCDACVKVCPTHIDIKKGISQLECINCLECADACTIVMAAYDKPSLISWTNMEANKEKRKPKYLRPRILVYIFALLSLTVGLFVMGSQKEYMLLNINRTTQLYKVKDNNTVENAYTFLFQNTDSKDHEYYFRVLNNDNIIIKRPTKSFLLKSDRKIRKIVVLKTNEVLVKDNTKDTPIAIKIEAYAIDDKVKVKVIRDTTFVYPRYDKLKNSN